MCTLNIIFYKYNMRKFNGLKMQWLQNKSFFCGSECPLRRVLVRGVSWLGDRLDRRDRTVRAVIGVIGVRGDRRGASNKVCSALIGSR